MADAVGNKAAKDYHFDVPAPDQSFFARGLGHTDWGMKNRISHLFSPETGNTVMLAFDHGYIMGSTAGLERLDVTARGDTLLHPAHDEKGYMPARHARQLRPL